MQSAGTRTPAVLELSDLAPLASLPLLRELSLNGNPALSARRAAVDAMYTLIARSIPPRRRSLYVYMYSMPGGTAATETCDSTESYGTTGYFVRLFLM